MSNVIQVFCGPGPAQAAAGLRVLLESEAVSVDDVEFDCRGEPPADLTDRIESMPETVIILWMGDEHLAGIADTLSSGRAYFSSTLLAGDFDDPVFSTPGPKFVAHPFRLPGQSDPALMRFKVWAKTRGIELSFPRRQSEAFFACLALKDAIAHMGRFFIRDYVLDTLDHAQSLVAYLPFHARPTLGPQQRFLNKGGYVLPMVDGQVVTQEAVWILP